MRMVAESTDGSSVVGVRLSEPWRLLHRYWLSKHVDGRPPARADIDPITEIPRLVANLMIIDAMEDEFVYRFVGTEVVAQTGEDMTGRPVGISRKYGPIRSTWVGALEFVKRNRQPRLLIYRFGPQVNARQAVLLLPLSAAPGGVFKILGGAFADGDFPPGLQVDGVSVQEVPA
jgi:hypothetical protein